MTGRADILWGIFEKNAKKLKIKYHFSDMIPVALPPRVASDGLQDPCPYLA